ncbi:hypothetical protein, partial [Pseudomonas aeruginosa]
CAHLTQWQLRVARGVPGLRTRQFAPLSFDMAFQEIFSTLCGGGELQLISNRERMDPSALLHVLERRQVQRVGGLGEALQGDEGQQHALDLAA